MGMRSYLAILLLTTTTILHANCLSDIRLFLLKDKNPLIENNGFLSDGQINLSSAVRVHFEEALVDALSKMKRAYTKILANKEAPTYKNTVTAYIDLMDRHRFLAQLIASLNEFRYNEELQKFVLSRQVLLEKFSEARKVNEAYLARLNLLINSPQKLSQEELLVAKKMRQNIAQAIYELKMGLKDPSEEKIKKAAELQSMFRGIYNKNLMEFPKNAKLTLSADLLQNESESVLKLLSSFKKGDAYELQPSPQVDEIIFGEVTNREVREAYFKFSENGHLKGPYSNVESVLQILKAREELALASKKKSYAELALEETMAGTPEVVEKFLLGILDAVIPVAKKEEQELEAFAKTFGIDDLRPWDVAFFTKKMKERLFNINFQELKKYFVLDRVLKEGIFYSLNKLYGVTFEEVKRPSVWNPDVLIFKVKDEMQNSLGLIYLDLFERTGEKSGGASNGVLKTVEYGLLDGKRVPYQTIKANLKRPMNGAAALLSLNDVTMLFHESGHMAHKLFQTGKKSAQRGTSRDFVEIPSQFFENYAFHPEVFSRIARHVESGEVMPQVMFENAMKMKNFRRATTLRAMALMSYIDFKLHTLPANQIPEDLVTFERSLLPQKYHLNMTAKLERSWAVQFRHIFVGGYPASYYAYLWSEAYAKHTWDKFLDEGIFNLETAKKWREIVFARAGHIPEKKAYELFNPKQVPGDILLRGIEY